MTQTRRNSYFLILFFLFSAVKIFAEEDRRKFELLDRLLVSINKTHYTQRDLEIYFFVKNILEENKIKEELNQDTWTSFLSRFADEYLIYQTAREVAFYEKTDLEESEFLYFFKKVQAHVMTHEKTNQQLIHLNPSASELQMAFLNWRIIRGFIEQRDSINQTDFYTEEKPAWFLLLKENANIRFYKEAYSYEALSPF